MVNRFESSQGGGTLLFDGHIPEVATHIRALGTQQSAVCEILEREARYFEKHAKRMQYKAFREKGYQIGSGVIECVSTGCGA